MNKVEELQRENRNLIDWVAHNEKTIKQLKDNERRLINSKYDDAFFEIISGIKKLLDMQRFDNSHIHFDALWRAQYNEAKPFCSKIPPPIIYSDNKTCNSKLDLSIDNIDQSYISNNVIEAFKELVNKQKGVK